jgi:hypothetical protein
MNSHTHQHVIPEDPHKQIKFYMEYQKKVTDTVRKLTKMKRLQLWEERPSVFFMAELEDAIERIIYMFLNPGLNTWKAFKSCEPSVDAEVSVQSYWTPVSVLEALPDGNRLSPANDRAMAKRLKETKGTIEYKLVIKPLAWLKLYGVTDPKQIEAIRKRIIKAVYAEEAALLKERIDQKKSILGAERLRQQQYLKSHTPKKKERRIFVICGNDTVRPQIIAAHKDISAKHRRCYQDLKDGPPQEWPPGTFIPWVPTKVCRQAYKPGYC